MVLFSSGEETDWPDTLNVSTGQFTYYGDNRKPGSLIHETGKGGNALLQRVFASLHSNTETRAGIPPFFVFRKRATSASSRSVQFLGLAVPGFPGLSGTEDLVAVWKSTAGQRFQNYRAAFTVLKTPVVQRAWIDSLATGTHQVAVAPEEWTNWRASGKYSALSAPPTKVIRNVEEQLPDTLGKKVLLNAIWERYKDDCFGFERFAARVYQLMDSRVTVDEITRGVVDGGRDAVGRYLLGLPSDPVFAEFALEAKCYRPPSPGHPGTTVGVSEASRLISRIKNRQFGILVTTSVVSRQVYQEVREDGHPILFLSGRDVAEILIRAGYHEPSSLTALFD